MSIEVSLIAARAVLVGVRADSDDATALDAYARLVWSVLTEPGDGVAGRLIAERGAPEALRSVMEGEVAGAPSAEMAAAWARWSPRIDSGAVTRAAESARRAGVRLVIPGDAAWPERVDDLGVHAPAALWTRGDTSVLASSRPAVAIVGARAATSYGDHVAAELAGELAASGVTVVSGAAYGIDGAAHRAALASGGRTAALLAGGVDRPYPSGHSSLIEEIAQSGALLAETPCGSAPTKWRFLARNRLIAALSDATIVVEAGMRSGSLNTAAHAASLGRALGAVPGPVTSAASAGCHLMIREFDAACITSAADVRVLLDLGAGEPAAVGGERTDEVTRVLDATSTRVSRQIDEIARRSGLSVPDVQAVIALSALAGDVTEQSDGWRRSRVRR